MTISDLPGTETSIIGHTRWRWRRIGEPACGTVRVFRARLPFLRGVIAVFRAEAPAAGRSRAAMAVPSRLMCPISSSPRCSLIMASCTCSPNDHDAGVTLEDERNLRVEGNV